MESPTKVVWTVQAKDDLLEVFESLEKSLGWEHADTVTSRLVTKSFRLEQFPAMGPIEWRHSDRFKTVRYLVEGHYKIYYEIRPDSVEILSVFDTRQNPERLRNP